MEVGIVKAVVEVMKVLVETVVPHPMLQVCTAVSEWV